MKTIVLSTLLFGVSICLTIYSSEQVNFLFFGTLLVVAILGTLATSIWFKGNFKEKLFHAVKIVIPITAMVFLLGYFYVTIKVML